MHVSGPALPSPTVLTVYADVHSMKVGSNACLTTTRGRSLNFGRSTARHALAVDEHLPPDVVEWIVDCGATKHCTPHLSDLAEAYQVSEGSVKVGNGARLRVSHIGRAKLRAVTANGTDPETATAGIS